MANYFFDWEFDDENGQLEPISLGIVCDDGREYYAVNEDYDENQASAWLKKNVIPYLGKERKPLSVIKQEVYAFISENNYQIKFMAWYSAWDFMLLMRLLGGWHSWPSSWPFYCIDLRAIIDWEGIQTLPKQTGQQHNALEDAKWNFEVYKHIKKLVP